jgi:TolB-like protein
MNLSPFRGAFVCALVLSAVSGAFAQAQESKKPMVAVIPFSSRVLDTSAIEGLVSAMGSELMNTGKFRVLERLQMESILKEQGFAQSGACDGSECAIEMGKLLSVDQMVLGSIAKVGDIYTMTARLVNVQTGEILKSATRNSKADIGAILTDILPQLAQALADAKPSEPVAVAPQAPIVVAPAAAPLISPAPSEHAVARSVPVSASRKEATPAVEEKGGGHWGWWLAGATVVASGAMAAVLLLSDKGRTSSTSSTESTNGSWQTTVRW